MTINSTPGVRAPGANPRKGMKVFSFIKAVLLVVDIAFFIFVFNLGETVAGVQGGFIAIGLFWSFVIMFCLTDRLLETKLRRRRQRRAAVSLGLPWLKHLDPEFFITVLMSSKLSKKQATEFAWTIAGAARESLLDLFDSKIDTSIVRQESLELSSSLYVRGESNEPKSD